MIQSEPWPLPGSWRWVRIRDVAEVRSDLRDPSATPQAVHIAPNHIEARTGRLIGRGTVLGDQVTSPKHVFTSGQILYSKIRPYLAKVAMADCDGLCSADMYPISVCEDRVDSRFFRWWLLSPAFTAMASQSQGRTVLPKINQAALYEKPVPLPPLDEQKRIADKLDSLLAQVDACRERLGRVLALLKVFRQSVLVAACSGDLTREWREANAEWRRDAALFAVKLSGAVACPRAVQLADANLAIPDGWPVVSLASVTSLITSGSRAWSRYYKDDGSGTFVMAQNIKPMRFDQSYRQGVEPPKDDPERKRTMVSEHDILVTIVGANTGDVCRVGVPVHGHYVCQSVALVRFGLLGFDRFAEIWLNSSSHGQRLYREWAYGEGRPHLSFDHLKSTPIAVPGANEQIEIIRQVDRLFAVAEGIEKRVRAANEALDKLPPRILSKAFAGELVPSDARSAA